MVIHTGACGGCQPQGARARYTRTHVDKSLHRCHKVGLRFSEPQVNGEHLPKLVACPGAVQARLLVEKAGDRRGHRAFLRRSSRRVGHFGHDVRTVSPTIHLLEVPLGGQVQLIFDIRVHCRRHRVSVEEGIGSPNRLRLVDSGHLLDHRDSVSHARFAGAGAGAWAHLIRGRRLRVQMNMQS